MAHERRHWDQKRGERQWTGRSEQSKKVHLQGTAQGPKAGRHLEEGKQGEQERGKRTFGTFQANTYAGPDWGDWAGTTTTTTRGPCHGHDMPMSMFKSPMSMSFREKERAHPAQHSASQQSTAQHNMGRTGQAMVRRRHGTALNEEDDSQLDRHVGNRGGVRKYTGASRLHGDILHRITFHLLCDNGDDNDSIERGLGDRVRESTNSSK
ncbi:hypothetical protein GQ607_012934 [Colletotrichum asianum]|uniref:Uncharacterized protein n=1 Tax=Colletotrichum asianum TaxID=702518 RepID=A0A8H3W7Y0_9PEZI|nr:hypothetical protein GQ607_012934 [Colletotrichum asianum]